eukprot:PITA_09797
MEEGKLLGHIISKDDIRIDLARVQEIQEIDLPRNKKEIQSFNGKMNFLCCFVPNLAEHLKEMTNMLKKDSQVKWTEKAVKSFNLVKLALSSEPVLVSSDYTQDYILFSFASEHTMTTVLLQKRDDHERTIAFFSRAIRDATLKYKIIEKQALALVKALKYFWVYILHSHILAYAPNAVVKDVLVQVNPEGRRGKWIAALLEYDIEIKPTKLPLPLKPIEVSAPFQQLELDFIGEIHPASSGQHKWILIATDYFKKWIEAIPTRQATDVMIISFLENNILSRFGCPNKLITDNTATFKSKRMVECCHKYHIILGHSTTYHLQGNGLAESSNKSLVNIIKKLLEINKKSWHKRLVNALWADQVSQKKSIGTSPFELVYGVDTVFPSSLTAPVVKLLQEAGSEEDPMQRRLNQMVHLQQTREEFFKSTSKLQEKIKKIYDRKAKVDKF